MVKVRPVSKSQSDLAAYCKNVDVLEISRSQTEIVRDFERVGATR